MGTASVVQRLSFDSFQITFSFAERIDAQSKGISGGCIKGYFGFTEFAGVDASLSIGDFPVGAASGRHLRHASALTTPIPAILCR